MMIKKNILIIGPDGEIGGVYTHVKLLKSILKQNGRKIKITKGLSFFCLVDERFRFRPDIIIYNLSVYRNQILKNMLARLFMVSRNTTHILHLHGGIFSNIRLAHNPFWQIFLKYYLKSFDQIFCLTDEQYIAVKSNLGDYKKIKKIYNYVELPGKDLLDKNEQDLNLLYIGRLHFKKGIMDAVKAVLQLNEKRIKLWIIGEGELDSHLKKIQDPRIIFLGKKFGRDKNSFLSKAHVFLLPSFSEALPYALLEAAAYGLALISTRVGAVDEILFDGQNGFFVEFGNVSMITQKLQIFIKDRILTLKMGEESRRICEERFSILRLQQIYDNFLKV